MVTIVTKKGEISVSASREARPERAEEVWPVGHAVDRDACWVLATWRPP